MNPRVFREYDIRGVADADFPDDFAADLGRSAGAYFAEDHNRRIVANLVAELTIEDAERPKTDTAIAGKTIVFTGSLESMSRSEAKARAEVLGANVTSSVSAKTDYVVAGADPGSKATKAAALGVKLLDEADWLSLAAG